MDQRDDRRLTRSSPPEAADAAARRRRLAEVFGEVLPDHAEDDRSEPGERRSDEEYLRDRPPHHLPRD